MKYTELPKLEDRTMYEKMLFVFRIILSIAVIITAIVEITNLLNWVKNVSQLLLGGMFFVMFLEYRKYNTLQACLSLVISIFIISIFVIDYYNILI
ncbi:hypothetical protein [Clostridium butyricum]|uniref:hypothetical protein n=1 Tax=Clostridium butyricum TaxID=1492 RepID=UPI00071D6329|nr:hypothetical protein [Clostridium butyricum]MDU5821924.1 hypothetical protein [Clostridium butyricum]